MQQNNQRTLITILLGAAVLVFGAFVVLSLAQLSGGNGSAPTAETTPAAEGDADEPADEGGPAEEDDAPAETSEETPEDDTAAETPEGDEEGSDAVGEGTPTAAPDDSTGEGTPTGEPADEGGETTQSSDGGAPTPTSRSRTNNTIQIGTPSTPVLRPTEAAPSSSESGEGAPTPTSRSRVDNSILIGADDPADDETGTETPEPEAADDEATPEATEEASGGAPGASDQDGDSGGGSDGTVALPTAVPGRPAGPPSALRPAGPVSARQSMLLWLMIGAGSAVYLLVVGIIFRILLQRDTGGDALSPRHAAFMIGGGGIALPLVVITILFGLTLGTLSTLAVSNSGANLTVEVTGLRWWWDVRYPDHDVVTANEIHIPAGQPVEFILKSDNVIHSFWVPELGGKMDLIPGRTNRIWLQADAPGTYRGQCAEYCGIAHAQMAFYVVAHEPQEFDAWLAHQREPAPEPADELIAQGRDVFARCAACHTVRGTDAAGVTGPDLTHFASRLTIAAGTVPNTPGYLAGWIVDPQGIKHGSLMPPQDVTGEELHALLAYLGSLE